MPTDCTWAGTVSSNIDTAGNWTPSKPAAGDSAYWTGNTPYPMATGTLANAVNLVVTEGVQADFGTNASPINLGSVTTARFANRGHVFCTAGANTVGAASFEMPTGFTATLSGGTWTTTAWFACRCNGGASAVFTNIYSLGANDCIVATSGTAITMFAGWGKWTIDSRNITNGEVEGGGTLVLTGTSAIATGVKVFNGGTVSHKSSGNIAGGDVRRGGLITPKGNPNQATSITITATVWSGGMVVTSVEGFTYGTATLTYRGPQTVPPPSGI